MRRTYPYKGKERTLNELEALATEGVDARLISQRLRSGVDIETALTRPRSDACHRARKLYEYQGEHYTMRALADIAPNGASYSVIRHRLVHGWDVEQAITIPSGRTPSRSVTNRPQIRRYPLNGEMLTVEELAAVAPNKLSVRQISVRLQTGWDVREAITLPKFANRRIWEPRLSTDDMANDLKTVMRWISAFGIMSCWTTLTGETVPAPDRTGEREYTLERELYKWVFTFSDADIFTVKAIFRNTDEISWPIYTYRLTCGRFEELARIDKDGSNILRSKAGGLKNM